MEVKKLFDLKAVAAAHPFILISSTVLVLIFVLLTGAELANELRTQNRAAVSDSAAQQLREQQAREENVLNTYKLLDSDRGVVQIPIDRAMELVAHERSLKSEQLTRKPGR